MDQRRRRDLVDIRIDSENHVEEQTIRSQIIQILLADIDLDYDHTAFTRCQNEVPVVAVDTNVEDVEEQIRFCAPVDISTHQLFILRMQVLHGVDDLVGSLLVDDERPSRRGHQQPADSPHLEQSRS